MFSFYFIDLFVVTIYPDCSEIVAPLLCYFYVVGIGCIKKIMYLLVRHYELDMLYEIASLAFGSFVFRFVFFTLTTEISLIILLSLKLFYKICKYVVIPVIKTQNCVKEKFNKPLERKDSTYIYPEEFVEDTVQFKQVVNLSGRFFFHQVSDISAIFMASIMLLLFDMQS